MDCAKVCNIVEQGLARIYYGKYVHKKQFCHGHASVPHQARSHPCAGGFEGTSYYVVFESSLCVSGTHLVKWGSGFERARANF